MEDGNGQGPEPEKKKKKKRSAKKIAQILEKGTRILELRKNGASLRQISAILIKEAEKNNQPTRGLSYEQIRRVFWEIVDLRIAEQNDAVDEIRILCAERLDEVLLNCMPLLRTGDNDTKLKAALAVTRASKEYAELFGAKRPQQINTQATVRTYAMSKEEWEEEAAQKLNAINTQFEKFDDDDADNSEDQNTPGTPPGAGLESLFGNRD